MLTTIEANKLACGVRGQKTRGDRLRLGLPFASQVGQIVTASKPLNVLLAAFGGAIKLALAPSHIRQSAIWTCFILCYVHFLVAVALWTSQPPPLPRISPKPPHQYHPKSAWTA